MKILFVFLACLLFLPTASRAETGTLCGVMQSPIYVPGIDVHGNPVVPADLSAPMPEAGKVDIPLTVDLARHFGIAVPQGVELKPQLGMISIYRDGRVSYNGQDITAQADGLCGVERKTEQPPEELNPEPPQAASPPPPEPKEEIIWGEGN